MYIAPELLRGEVKEASEATDMFSCGQIALELLLGNTGGVVFNGEDDTPIVPKTTDQYIEDVSASKEEAEKGQELVQRLVGKAAA
jgi:serine/threonine protein kinase